MEDRYFFVKTYLNEKDINLLHGNENIFWVDWREYDEDIVIYCNIDGLTSETIPADNKLGYEFFVLYKEKKIRVLFDEEDITRDPTFAAINEATSSDYEVRLCMDSVGSDTLAFIVLSVKDWTTLDNEFGTDVVTYHFEKITKDTKMFALSMGEIGKILKERDL